jgi:hypothetical protein
MRIGDRTSSPSVTRALCEQTKARGNAAVVAPTCRQLGQATKRIIWARCSRSQARVLAAVRSLVGRSTFPTGKWRKDPELIRASGSASDTRLGFCTERLGVSGGRGSRSAVLIRKPTVGSASPNKQVRLGSYGRSESARPPRPTQGSGKRRDISAKSKPVR